MDIAKIKQIENRIYTIRDKQVMLDVDLAELYEVQTKRLNEQVKRNIERFPQEFRFQLNKIEKSELVAKCDRFEKLKHSTSLPYAFTEQGVAMLSAILKSEVAIKVSLDIINTFVKMRKVLSQNSELFQKIEQIEKKQISYEIKSDERFDKIFSAIESKSLRPKQGIFYNGQVYDAYIFVSNLIKDAKESIMIIDNYVDDSVLTLLSKREKNVKCTIYTKNITKQLKLDLEKYNSQYQKIEIKMFEDSHDRFLILDNKEIYHIGASLKDLGKKWFAFSKFNKETFDILSKLEFLNEI